MTLAASLALLSALGFAFSTSLQHRAAGDVPVGVSNPALVLWRLLHHPRWLLGSTVGLTAWLLHATALHYGTLSLVQPIILLGVVLAVVVRAAMDRAVPARHEIVGVVVTVVSLIVIVSVADTDQVDSTPRAGLVAGVVLAAWVVAGLATASVNRLPRRGLAAFSLGMTSGLLFGVSAVLMKLAGNAVADHGPIGALATWSPWLLLVTAFCAMSLNQRAYQLSRLAHSMPVLNVTSVLVSILLGAMLFGETLPDHPATLTLQACGLVGIAWGLWRIATSENRFPVELERVGVRRRGGFRAGGR